MASRAPSAWRAATSAASACVKPAAAAPVSTAASSSACAGRSTPGRPSSASARGTGLPGMRPCRSIASASACSSAAGSATRRGSLSRFTDRFAVTLPRFSTLPAASRSAGSSASQPGGRRKRRSRPRPLTLRSSHTQARPAALPSARANPVIEARALLMRRTRMLAQAWQAPRLSSRLATGSRTHGVSTRSTRRSMRSTSPASRSSPSEIDA